jgi:hypothetical protein
MHGASELMCVVEVGLNRAEFWVRRGAVQYLFDRYRYMEAWRNFDSWWRSLKLCPMTGSAAGWQGRPAAQLMHRVGGGWQK